MLADVEPMKPKKTLIVGALGQLGRALTAAYPDADLVDLDELDVTDPAQVEAWPWNDYGLVLNAAAYTCLLYTSPSPRDGLLSRMPSSA